MSQSELVKTILINVFPKECQAVGPTTVDELVEGETTIEQSDEGRSFPIMELVAFLKDAAQFTAAVLAVYLLIKQNKPSAQKPTVSELNDNVLKSPANKGRLTDTQVAEIFEEIHRRN